MKKYFTISLIAITLFSSLQQTFAQDGAQLFKAKCNACHMIDKNSTGPILKGVVKKWTDAGEAEMLYEWVKNPANLVAGGKSQMANAIKGFSPTEMPAQAVTNEEVDAILSYVDSYEAPVVAPPKEDSKVPVTIVPNYHTNLTLFYWLCFSILLLLLAIMIMSTSISSLIKSDFFKKKIESNGSKGTSTLLAIIGFFGFMTFSNQSFALTFMQPGEAEKGMPWLLVENIDIYFLITLNIILLGVLLYLRRMFKDFLAMVITPKPSKKELKKKTSSLNKILTDVVPIEEEHTILMHHEYDGIQELDNNLPPWWVWGFYATIVFSVVYMFNYHVLKTGDLQITEYEKEIAQSKIDIDTYLSKMAMNVDENNATLLTDAAAISSGKALYEANCIACHNPNGEGNIGPNLTDNHWIYGPDIKDLFKTIKLGTPNGMPEHASKLNPIQLQEVSSFVLSMKDAKGKEPEGKQYDNEGKVVN